VNLICVAFEGLERFFPKEKIRITGNPVRNNMVAIEGKREKALEFFGLRPDMPVLLVTGGSLGARSINQAIFESLEHIVEQGVQVIWQTGKLFIEVANDHFGNHALVSVHPFIQKMDLAYAASDLIVARAGAITVSEIELVNKPAILIPLPSAAEDHQTQNALKLVEKKAAVLIPDSQAKERLGKEVIRLMKTPELREELISNLKSMGHSNATERIVDEMEKLWQLK
jgi:UDP-N-acetylglucosamine--N-acetylmuramyl-(pentapeptide) pyrophosphoryl-undecaprenol N-acetylglucosamine transferase